jgi:hypothetical protein
MFKYFFDVSILILRKLLYPRRIVVFYFKKIYGLHFFAKHLIKIFFFKYTSDIDLRFYWNRNHDINSYFNFKKFESRELGNELRNCIKIPSKKFYILETTKANLNLKFGFYFETNYKNKIDGSIFVEDINKNYLVKLKDLTFSYWHDAWINSNKKKKFKIINNTNLDLFFSYTSKKLQTKKIKNIIHLVLDSMDMQTIGLGKKNTLMPNTLDFFNKSIIYSNCFSSSEWTLPWTCSYLKGEMPSKHRLTDPKNSKQLNSPYKDNIFDLIIRNNYSLVGFGPRPIYNPFWNNVQNFDKFFPTDGSFEKKLDLLNVSKKIIENIEVKNSNNFFYAHLLDSHFPWSNRGCGEDYEMGPFRSCDPYTLYHRRLGQQDTKAEPIFEKKISNQLNKYFSAKVKTIDRNLTFLINYLKIKNLLKSTVIILSSDHGQAFHGGPNHLLNFKKTNVPLMIFHPDFKNKKVNEITNNSVYLNYLVKLIINKKNNNLLKSEFVNKNKKRTMISESIYGNRYKVTIRSKKFSYHLSCFFNKEKNIIDMTTIFYENIFNFRENKKLKNNKSIINFRIFLKEHLLKNFIGEVKWFA